MFRRLLILGAIVALLATALPVNAHDGADDGDSHSGALERPSASAGLTAHDASLTYVVSDGPSTSDDGPLSTAGRGVRSDEGSTTDVWAHAGYAYTGTFSSPCGGEPGAGVWVWKTKRNGGVSPVGLIPSEAGDRTNDVKVAGMNSGDILVMSNESCGGGDGGFEIYDVDDPTNPVKLASVTIDELNPISNAIFGGITNVGVHNLFLFTQGSNDYVGVVAETAFDNFMIYDINDPTAPSLESAWGAEELFDPGVGDELVDGGRVFDAAIWLLGGFGASANRFLHDITITADGTQAYLANWDAGLVLLNISDVTNPAVVSVAIDPGSEDGEVNSHAVWPSEDGLIVIEGEEDFAPFSVSFTIDTGPSAGPAPATEGAFTTPIYTLPGGVMTGVTTYVGRACSAIAAGSGIALIQRGDCRFDLKATNAIDAGYAGIVVFNNGDDATILMGGDARDIPGVGVGESTGLAIAGAGVSVVGDLVVGATGETVTASAIPDGWSGFRIWDYADSANPVLASTFNTVCSENPIDEICDPAGTYSAHNVIVETTGDKVIAYISWYTDGILILDITDPYHPFETGRFSTPQAEFWGVYKIPDQEWIYGSDRNGGLWLLQELGADFGRGDGRGQKP